jgi:hypothetical protein
MVVVDAMIPAAMIALRMICANSWTRSITAYLLSRTRRQSLKLTLKQEMSEQQH